MARFRVELDPPQHGWLLLRIRTEQLQLAIHASYVPRDSISDLAGAISLLRQGGSEAVGAWNEEPKEYDFHFLVPDRDAQLVVRRAGVKPDGVELHLQWHDAGWEYPNDRPTYRFVVQDVDGLFEELKRGGGLSATSAVRDTPWGTREFHVQDPDRNGLRFYRPL